MIPGKVYGLYDLRDGTLRYIGQTVRSLKDRLSGHMTSARRGLIQWHVTRWIASLLKQGLHPEIVLLGEADTRPKLDALEVRLISEARAHGCALANIRAGGGGLSGVPMSDAHRKKLHNPEVWARMAASKKGRPTAMKGKRHSAAALEKIRKSRRGKTAGTEHPQYRHDVSDERIVQLMHSGMSTTEVSQVVGLDRHTVRGRIVKLRAAGIATPLLRGELPTAEIIVRLQAGRSKRQVADELGITVACIWDRLKKAEQQGVPVPRSRKTGSSKASNG